MYLTLARFVRAVRKTCASQIKFKQSWHRHITELSLSEDRNALGQSQLVTLSRN